MNGRSPINDDTPDNFQPTKYCTSDCYKTMKHSPLCMYSIIVGSWNYREEKKENGQ